MYLQKALESIGLREQWEVIRNSAIELLKWPGEGSVLKLPKSLVAAARKKKTLEDKAGLAFNQAIDANGVFKVGRYATTF